MKITLYSSQIDVPQLKLKCKAEYEQDFRLHTGTRAQACSSSEGKDIFDSYLGSMTNTQLRKAHNRFMCEGQRDLLRQKQKITLAQFFIMLVLIPLKS